MKLNAEEAEVLRKLLSVLGEARHEFVIAGGQAARLFRLHPLAQPVDWDPLLTRDVDVATRMKGHAGSVDIGNALKGAGFTLRFDGDDKPPLTHYILGGSELEFIVPDTPERHSTGATISVSVRAPRRSLISSLSSLRPSRCWYPTSVGCACRTPPRI